MRGAVIALSMPTPIQEFAGLGPVGVRTASRLTVPRRLARTLSERVQAIMDGCEEMISISKLQVGRRVIGGVPELVVCFDADTEHPYRIVCTESMLADYLACIMPLVARYDAELEAMTATKVQDYRLRQLVETVWLMEGKQTRRVSLHEAVKLTNEELALLFEAYGQDVADELVVFIECHDGERIERV